MKLFFIVLACCIAQSVHGAFERMPLGARSTALGGSSLALGGKTLELHSNPSIAAHSHDWILSLNYVPSLFDLRELSRASFVCIAPSGVGTFALSGSRFGFDLYREVTLTSTFAFEALSGMAVGVNLDWYSLVIQNYGSATAVGTDVGLLMNVAESVCWGFSGQNLNAPTVGAERERLPQVFSTGLVYQPNEASTIVAELVKDIRYAVDIRIGIEYSFLGLLDLRGGASTDPSTYGGGIGLHYAGFLLDYALRVHPDLGSTHHVSFTIAFGDL